MTPPPAPEALAWVLRSGMIESVHYGYLTVRDESGQAVAEFGSPQVEIYPRSSLKPIQAVAMLREGVELSEEQIALVCASHNGQAEHVRVVRSILAGAALSESDLQNTPSWPLQTEAATEWRESGGEQASITQNCSGKHAGMLATCAHRGWDTATYLEVDHPLQRRILQVVTELTGAPIEHVAVDGCGAPQPSTTLAGLAQAFRLIATAPAGTAEYRVAQAMRHYPFLVAGTGRDATAAMEQVPGLIAKDGAEGVYAAALPNGASIALKVADGASRPRPVLLAAALRILGADLSASSAADAAWQRVEILGHGKPVGEVVPAFPTASEDA